MGADFIDYTPYLLPLTAIFLLVTLAAFAYRVRERRGFWPFAVGSVAAVIVLIGKFAFDSDVALNAGITLLVAASLECLAEGVGRDCGRRAGTRCLAREFY